MSPKKRSDELRGAASFHTNAGPVLVALGRFAFVQTTSRSSASGWSPNLGPPCAPEPKCSGPRADFIGGDSSASGRRSVQSIRLQSMTGSCFVPRADCGQSSSQSPRTGPMLSRALSPREDPICTPPRTDDFRGVPEDVSDESHSNNLEAMSLIVKWQLAIGVAEVVPVECVRNLCAVSAVWKILRANRHVLQFRNGHTTSLQRNSRKRSAETEATHGQRWCCALPTGTRRDPLRVRTDSTRACT
jgi:hypothetical protein